MPTRKQFTTIGVSPSTVARLKERTVFRQSIEDVIIYLLDKADKYDRIYHQGKFKKENHND